MLLSFTNQTVKMDATLSFDQMKVLEEALNKAVEMAYDTGQNDIVPDICEVSEVLGVTIQMPEDEGKETEKES